VKLGMKVHYAILLVLYLQQNGQKRTLDAAKGLNLSLPFMEQIARKLRIAGVIKSARGPGGGYSVVGDPTVGQILDAIEMDPLLTDEETTQYRGGNQAHQAFALLVDMLLASMGDIRNAPISKLWATPAAELPAAQGAA
jgi:Rrf2 family iron-sulfur cluster assembly transcriptional regulator